MTEDDFGTMTDLKDEVNDNPSRYSDDLDEHVYLTTKRNLD